MGGLSGGAVEHLIPVVEIVAALFVALVAIVGTLWGGFRWLRGVIAEEFKALVLEWTAANDRRHAEHDRAIEDLRERDNERAEAVKRLHGRVDAVWERVPRG